MVQTVLLEARALKALKVSLALLDQELLDLVVQERLVQQVPQDQLVLLEQVLQEQQERQVLQE